MHKGAQQHKRSRRGFTFRVLVAVPFCVALVIQAAICVVALDRSAILRQMDADAYNLFSERVESHASNLENDMIFQWSDFDLAATQIETHIAEELARNGWSAADLSTGGEAALRSVQVASDDMLSLIRRSEVDGVFVVLENQDKAHEEDARTALYIRDSNPTVHAQNDTDLMLAACPISLGRELGLALDSQWSATFELAPEGEDQSAFYYRPLRAAEQYPKAEMMDLGYWGRPVDLGWAGAPSITYSLPLKDQQGGLVGVLGVEVRLDRVESFFPYTHLGNTDEGSYVLAITGNEGNYAHVDGVMPVSDAPRSYEVLTSTGATQSLYVANGRLEAYLDEQGRMMIESTSDSLEDTRAVASVFELMIYDSTSPFADEHWTLVGLEHETALFEASRSLWNNLLVAFAVSLVIGMVVAALTSWLSSSRVRQLMGEVRTARPEQQPISFTPTGIVEIDELSESIETMGAEVAASASRLSQILQLSDRGIGAFEYNKESNTVMYTDGFFTTLSSLDLPGSVLSALKQPISGGSFFADEFKRLMERYKDYMRLEEPGRYLITDAQENTWLRLAIIDDEEIGRTYGLIEDVTHEIKTRKRIEHERDHDILTGILNRRAFEQEVTQRLEGDNPPAFAAMMMLDLDNLKFINDTYGHDWGDLYIKAAGRVISQTFAEKGCCARISGDEFLAFVDTCTDRADAAQLFDEFSQALSENLLQAPDGKTLKVRASMGIAYYPDDALDFARLREYADFAMYLAKSSRKGELVEFDRATYDQKSFMVNGKEELNRLFDEELVEFHFQPIVDARAGEVVGFEALMRPQGETITTPDLMLALARSQSMLYRVEHLTFFGALKAFARFEGARGATLFVNSIATQRLSSDDELLLKERYGAILPRLVIEIIESDYGREMAVYKEALVRRFGARLAIDDFGSGYNGETSLLDYRVDIVKLDIGIVRGIDTMKDRQDIARNLITYAHDRGIRVIAEGVETEAELRELVVLDVDYIQGFLVARPAPEPRDIPEEIKQLIRSLS